MEVVAVYRPPLATAVHTAWCSASSSALQTDCISLRAWLGEAKIRRSYTLVSLNFRNTRLRSTVAVRADVGNSQGTTISSPFTEEEKKGLYSPEVYDELTVENVDLVLNEVRPYLISDGGNVEVASVDDGVVSLRLQGACGSCPSSTTTMKMGIERVLNEKFGVSLKGVVQVDQQQTRATVLGVDSHLEMLRPAIHNYGGFVQVVSVSREKGLAVIKYKGPAPIASGIKAAIKDAFPDITEVVLVDEHHS